ncbi:hypothetical protein [Novosphingobium sp. Leaf2]|uniref:hypothetical protein n=1 Tax=Novosphingobium sp. Leaf2 TaxID=1735670 RepID=UPI0006F7D10F|nr:hypothetical protein [Novosphingobium sp. Leaf2]KQM12980.1 hypothetical protein ASE49_13345 [Novosphingobium sp. Leaf2]
MFHLWAPEHSVLREKVIEHAFLAELSRSLLLELAMPFEVLRSEFDAFGYDIVIDANGVLRHVQLKASTTGGARAHVDVQLALAAKPGGCVVWVFVDPKTLRLGPFLWFGGAPGEPLPSLGDRAVRHTRGDSEGTKKVRAGLRRLPKGSFVRFEEIGNLAKAMFGPGENDHAALLAAHLASRAAEVDWPALRGGLTWVASERMAYVIDGFELARKAGLGDPFAFADRMRATAMRCGEWSGTALELWVALFMEHRRARVQSQGLIGLDAVVPELPMLDELCDALTSALTAGC